VFYVFSTPVKSNFVRDTIHPTKPSVCFPTNVVQKNFELASVEAAERWMELVMPARNDLLVSGWCNQAGEQITLDFAG